MLEFLNIWIILYYFIKNNEKNLLSKNKFNSILYFTYIILKIIIHKTSNIKLWHVFISFTDMYKMNYFNKNLYLKNLSMKEPKVINKQYYSLKKNFTHSLS